MKLFLLLALFFTSLIADENIHPSEFTVKLIKKCEVLALSVEPNRKAKKIYTNIWTDGCVQNLGCMREITQKELDEVNGTKRDFMAWKYPVWCKVDADGKRGWVRKQFLVDEPCKQQD
ncbi:hypothetical protein [Sulfurovum sp.]|uniref:hypothetical protein n=1 Tax=Sulfurovum sp. TaxID=1969726 RepID=UPI003569A14A